MAIGKKKLSTYLLRSDDGLFNVLSWHNVVIYNYVLISEISSNFVKLFENITNIIICDLYLNDVVRFSVHRTTGTCSGVSRTVSGEQDGLRVE